MLVVDVDPRLDSGAACDIRGTADRERGFLLLHNRSVVSYAPGVLTHPLPDPLVELIARRFRALGEPLRIRLVEHLLEGEATVQELVEATGAGQQNVSKHLGLLRDAGIVARRKQGTFAHYRIVDPTVATLCEQVCGSVERHLGELGELVGRARTPQ